MSLYTRIRELYDMGNDLGAENSPAIKVVQRNLTIARMEHGRYNPIFNNAIQGVQSVEGALKELTEEQKAVKWYSLRRRNKSHNQRVDLLGELVGDCDCLKIDPLVSPEYTMGGVGAGLVTIALSVPPETLNGIITGGSLLGGVASGFVGIVYGLCTDAPLTFDRTKEARYLDEKINQFYR